MLIQANSNTSATNNSIIDGLSGAYASFAPGVSLINPSWSYYVYFMPKVVRSSRLQYLSSQGQGMSAKDQSTVKSIIMKNEPKGSCSCQNIDKIVAGLEQSFSPLWWNVVCHSEPTTEGLVQVSQNQWVSFKPYSCHYLIYAI